MTNIYKKSQSIPRTARNNRIYPGEYTGGNAPVSSGTGINLDWVSVTPEKVTINRDTHIEGNLTASEEVVAWVAGAVTSDVLAGLTATAPLRKSSASNIVLDYNASQFEVSGGILQIKAGVLAPSAHSHLISDISGLQAALDSKMVVHTHPYRPDSWVPSWTEVTGKPATFSPSTHGHAITDVTGLQAALDSKMVVHTHPYRPDSWVPSWSDVTGKPSFLALGETSTTAYRGDRGKIAYDHSQAAHQTIINGTGFVKASGTTISYDNTAYATAASLASYLPLSGGTMANTNLVTNLNADFIGGYKANQLPYLFSRDAGLGVTTAIIPAANRSANSLPSAYVGSFSAEFKYAAGIGFPVGDYAGLITYSCYTGLSASGAGVVFQLGYDATGGNSGDGLWLRTGTDSSWNVWRKIYHSGNANLGTVAWNASQYSINGVNINTAGTLSNVAYKGALTTNYLPKWDGSKLVNTQIVDNGSFVGIGYTADPTSGNKLAVNGTAYFNGNITAQIATLTGCNAQSFIIKDSGNNTRWTVSYNTSTYALEFKNASGVLECSIDQSGNLKAKGEVTAYATM